MPQRDTTSSQNNHWGGIAEGRDLWYSIYEQMFPNPREMLPGDVWSRGGSEEEDTHMPNRVIRDSILSNRQVEKLDWFQQVLLVRLILSCDDYGRYFAAPDIIRSYLFGISPGVTLDQVTEGMERLEELGFLFTYGVEGEIYCTFPQWTKYQVCRTRREKFPAPPPEAPGQELKKFAHKFHDAKQDSIGTAPETKSAPNPIQSESEIESEIKSESEAESESEGPAGQAAAAAENERVELVRSDAPAAWDGAGGHLGSCLRRRWRNHTPCNMGWRIIGAEAPQSSGRPVQTDRDSGDPRYGAGPPGGPVVRPYAKTGMPRIPFPIPNDLFLSSRIKIAAPEGPLYACVVEKIHLFIGGEIGASDTWAAL